MTTGTELGPHDTGYVDVNGVHMYVEQYGEGSPLVLLHGGLLTIELNFASLIPGLAGRRPGGWGGAPGAGGPAPGDRGRAPGPRPDGGHRPADHAGRAGE